MKPFLRIAGVIFPFALLWIILKLPAKVVIPGLKDGQANSSLDTFRHLQMTLLWLCPTAGIAISVSFSFIQENGRWFYVTAAVLYLVQLAFSLMILNMKWW